MADVIRVKARKNFQWEQDAKYIFVKVPMPGHTTLKNIQIFLSDLILRITSKQKKSVQTLDLLHEIDYLSHQNKFVLIDSTITATLKKKTQQPWQTLLIEQISLAELKTRRKQSQIRYEQNLKQNSEEKQKLKTEYDRKATQEMMRFQEEERKKLERKKEEEKRVALEEVFRGVDERTGRIGYQGDKWEEKGVKALEELEKQERQEYERQRQQRKKAQQQKYQKNDLPQPRPRPFNKNTQIFTQQDIKQQDEIRHNVQEQVQEIPVRKQAKVGVKFTEKLYPLVATRDYHYTEPPMPKGSAPLPPPKEGDLENRNPLWLKDRGDGFMRNKNYSAALDAYNEAIKIDPTQRKILMNRSLAHLKLLNFDSALNDCQLILAQMQKQLMNTEQNKDQSLLDLIKTKTRKALCLAYKGNLKASKQLLTELLTYPVPAQQKTQLEHAQALLQARQQSLRTKLRGDQCVKRQLYEQAVRHYREAIEIDGNQYALSNLGLCFNKLGRFEEAIQVCERGLKTVEEFLGAGAGSSVGKGEDHVNLVVKLLYRKATAQQSLKLYKQSQQTLKKALTLSPQDPSLKSSLQSLTTLQSTLLFTQLKTQASLELTQNSNPQSAITLYQKCLKLVESPDQVAEYLAVLQNLCVCYLRLQQWDNIVDSGRRILGIVNNLKSRVMDFQGSRKDGKQGKQGRVGLDRKNLDKIVVRTLMRRANAYVKLGQIYNAKSDLEKAVEIDPNDGNISKELEKLKESIGVK